MQQLRACCVAAAGLSYHPPDRSEPVMPQLSSARARLASFEHAYALATQLKRATGRDQFVVRTANPMQPVRVTTQPPTDEAMLLALVI